MALTSAEIARSASQASWDSAVRAWLWTVAALVVAMIAVGGATRLTDSGLSITEWKPILGAIPPLSEAHWQEAFAKYREIPEYHLVNKGMSLEEFKFIYWWEWGHRFLGRIIGLVFALPLALFWLKGALRPQLAPKLLGVLFLGGLQGVIGWFMVMSGLVERVDVSHYRLALHLTTAFVILGCVVWLALGFDEKPQAPLMPEAGRRRTATLVLALLFAQVVLGAFVAGLKGGLTHNTWPTMNGSFVPDEILALEPWYKNIVENAVTAQFNHRLVAYVLLLVAAWHALSIWRGQYASLVTGSAALLLAALCAQAALGIWTLLAAVPVGLGVAHQAFAAIVLIITTRHVHIAHRGLKPA